MKGTTINMDQCLLIRILLEEEMIRTMDADRFTECRDLRDYIRSNLGELKE